MASNPRLRPSASAPAARCVLLGGLLLSCCQACFLRDDFFIRPEATPIDAPSELGSDPEKPGEGPPRVQPVYSTPHARPLPTPLAPTASAMGPTAKPDAHHPPSYDAGLPMGHRQLEAGVNPAPLTSETPDGAAPRSTADSGGGQTTSQAEPVEASVTETMLEPPPNSCAVTGAGDALIYDGNSAPACAGSIAAPRVGFWEAFSDGSGVNEPSTPEAPGALGGRAGANDCAMHTQASKLTDWGGGTGFSLHQFEAEWCPYDASAFSGIELWIKGTARGTYSTNYVPKDNVLRIQVKSGPATDGDDYGFFCQIAAAQWTLCRASFASLRTEGWDATPPPFDAEWLRGIGIIAHRYDGGPAVSYDFWVDDVSFY